MYFTENKIGNCLQANTAQNSKIYKKDRGRDTNTNKHKKCLMAQQLTLLNEKQTHKQTERQTHKQTERQTHKQTERH